MCAKTNTIGIFGGASIEVVNRRFMGVLKYCAENKIQVSDFRRVNVIDDFSEIPPSWKRQVDGVIMCIGRAAHVTDQQLGDWVTSGGVPAVNMSADWFDTRVPIVTQDHLSLAKIAVDHLDDTGCKSFLFHGHSQSAGSAIRGQAFQKMLLEKGKKAILYDSDAYYSASYDDEDQATHDRKLIEHLQKLPKPIGVWAVNDQTANAISRICHSEHLKVPEQVKILGTDDTSITRMQLPMLSSIHTPAEEMGYYAAKILHKMIQQKKVPPVTELTNSQVVARESTVGTVRTVGDIDDVLAYIEQHACTGILVEELPKVMGISRRLFQEYFLKQVGHTPMQEIHRVRLERAKALLRQTQLSIGRIAVMVGFDEQAAFGKFFRQQTQLTPREFRERAATD